MLGPHESQLPLQSRTPRYEGRDIREIALAVEAVCKPERTYLYSLGSQQGNTHLHWHIAGLPTGVPYPQQQFHALMTENGVLSLPPNEAAEMAARLRKTIADRGVLKEE
ncbi:hypothetical protein [Streptomyces sp. NPDC048473]|uniref:hypothetical protein n=1 Tax=unclassified Streptomyces TaxID=2593676 RepID=UPI00371EB2F9